MSTIRTDRFTFDKEEKMFLAEVSDLQLASNDPIVLESTRTGRKTVLTCTEVRRDGEREVVAWVFRSTEPELRDLFSVHLLND